MKTRLTKNSLLPIIEQKLEHKFDSIINDDGEVLRKGYGQLVIDNSDESCIISRITTTSVDRDGDVLIPDGCDYSDFMKNPVVMLNHNYASTPIGKVVGIQVTEYAIFAKIKFGSTNVCQEVFSLIRDGILSANSVGFLVKRFLTKGTKEFNNYIASKKNVLMNNVDAIGRIITEWVLLENSIVSIPCNQDALIMAVSQKKISEDTIKLIGIKEVKEVKEVKEEPIITPIAPVIEPNQTSTDSVIPVVNEEPIKPKESKEPERYIRLVREPLAIVVEKESQKRIKSYLGKMR